MFVRWAFWLAAISLVLPLSATSRSLQYSKVRIQVSSATDVRRLASLGLALDEAGRRRGPSMDLFVDENEIRLLQEQGIPFETLIPDWRGAYAVRRAQDLATLQSVSGIAPPRNFHLAAWVAFSR